MRFGHLPFAVTSSSTSSLPLSFLTTNENIVTKNISHRKPKAITIALSLLILPLSATSSLCTPSTVSLFFPSIALDVDTQVPVSQTRLLFFLANPALTAILSDISPPLSLHLYVLQRVTRHASLPPRLLSILHLPNRRILLPMRTLPLQWLLRAQSLHQRHLHRWRRLQRWSDLDGSQHGEHIGVERVWRVASKRKYGSRYRVTHDNDSHDDADDQHCDEHR